MKLAVLSTAYTLSEEQAADLKKRADKHFGPGYRIVILSHGMTCELHDCPPNNEEPATAAYLPRLSDL